MDSRHRILFSYSNFSEMQPFTRQDFDILASQYHLVPVFWTGRVRGLGDTGRLFASLVTCGMAYFDFAYEHAYRGVRASRLLGRPSVVRIAGFDVVEEEWATGKFPSEWPRKLSRTLTDADKLITCSEALRERAMRYTSRRDIRVIPYGVDTERFRPGIATRERLVLTTSYLRRDYIRRKGLQTFLDAARTLQDFHFGIIGPDLDGTGMRLESVAPPNVTLYGGVATTTLINLLGRAQVYCQLSEHEGFGLALAEAMAVGCTPVVTKRGALPEVAGNAGIYVDYGDAAGTARAIEEAALRPDLGKTARQRIVEYFSVELRRHRLLEVFEELA